MKNKILSMGLALILLASLSLTTGCGTALFGKKIAAGVSGLVDSAKSALDQGNYTGAVDSANSVISDPSATTSQKDEAYSTKGQAQLGSALSSAGTNTTSLVNNIKSASGQDPLNTIRGAIPAALLTGQSSVEVAASAAALNSASSLDANGQTARATSNALAATQKVNSVFDINGDGQITEAELSELSSTEVTAKWSSINPTTGSGTQESVTNYVNNAADAGGTVFSGDASMMQNINKMQENINTANTSIEAGGIDGATLAKYLLQK